MSDFSEQQRRIFKTMREMYAQIDVLEYDPYPMMTDWLSVFSPIERMAWGEIRANGLPFWPQFPIGPYFADFADPIKKIVLECDGAAFHRDREKDRGRDAYMANLGYSVFRITGAACNRILPYPAEIIEDSGLSDWHEDAAASEAIRGWYLDTVDGLLRSIARQIYAPQWVGEDDEQGQFIDGLQRSAIAKWRRT